MGSGAGQPVRAESGSGRWQLGHRVLPSDPRQSQSKMRSDPASWAPAHADRGPHPEARGALHSEVTDVVWSSRSGLPEAVCLAPCASDKPGLPSQGWWAEAGGGTTHCDPALGTTCLASPCWGAGIPRVLFGSAAAQLCPWFRGLFFSSFLSCCTSVVKHHCLVAESSRNRQKRLGKRDRAGSRPRRVLPDDTPGYRLPGTICAILGLIPGS